MYATGTTHDAAVGGCRQQRAGGAHSVRTQSLTLETLAELSAVWWNASAPRTFGAHGRVNNRAPQQEMYNASNREELRYTDARAGLAYACLSWAKRTVHKSL